MEINLIFDSFFSSIICVRFCEIGIFCKLTLNVSFWSLINLERSANNPSEMSIEVFANFWSLLTKINANKFGVKNRVKIFKSDVDNFNLGKYDLIISNPPYIKKLDLKYLDKDVINFEPKLALDGGLEGISEIRKVINKSSELIKKKGKLILEIAFDQKNEVKKLLKNKGFYINNIVKDFAKNDRCIISTKI